MSVLQRKPDQCGIKSQSSLITGRLYQQLLKKSGKATDTLVYNFKNAAMQFLSKLCRHALEKCQLKSLFARCMQCLAPSYIGECPEFCILYERILTKFVEYNIITPSSADVSELLYHKFLSTAVKANKEEFMKFEKSNAKIACFLVGVGRRRWRHS